MDMTDVQQQAKQKIAGVVETVQDKTVKLSQGTPAQPVLGLPIKRVIPMDVHAVLDYVSAASAGLCGALADSDEAKTANFVLSGAGAGVSMLTDYRLSAAKVIPIEVHETIDYLWGIAAISAPFVLDYWKKDPLVSVMQISSGVLTLVTSLFTDYRGYRGVKW